MSVRVVMVGEYQPGYEPQEATAAAIGHAADTVGVTADATLSSWPDRPHPLVRGFVAAAARPVAG